MPWETFLTDEVNGWLDDLATVDDGSYRQVVYAIEALAEVGPNLGRPFLFVFDPWRSAILLSGDHPSVPERRVVGVGGHDEIVHRS